MKLKLQTEFKSLQNLDAPEALPDFTLITGPNGSGKSQLLAGIRHGSVLVDGKSYQKAAVFHTWENILASSWGKAQAQTMSDRFINLQGLQKKLITLIQNALRERNQIPSAIEAEKIARTPSDQLDRMFPSNDAGVNPIIKTIRKQEQVLLGELESKVSERELVKTIGADNLRVADASELTFFSSLQTNSLFQLELSTVFRAYRDEKLAYDVNRIRGRKPGDSIPPDEFATRRGIPPWDMLNEAFEEFGFDFRVTPPDVDRHTDVIPTLSSLRSGKTIPLEELSTGEKVIVALAVSELFGRIGGSKTPNIVLLDEVDAPLHPTLARVYIRAIQQTLIGRLGHRVIAVTHSPSTVALAPEDALHVLHPDHRLEKVTKDKALSVLTAGVPTLSLDYSGRRQVFVESELDSTVYTELYETHLKHRLASERSLQFIAAGNEDGGKDRVEILVNSLAEAGNRSIVGLLDWDGGKNSGRAAKSKGRLFISTPGRYGIENLLFDPLALVGALQLHAKTELPSLGLPSALSVADLKEMDTSKLQAFLDRVQLMVLGQSTLSSPEPVTYLDSRVLMIDRTYLEMQCHDLERAVFNAFPSLRGARSQGDPIKKLHMFMVKNVFVEYPEFIPLDIDATLRSLLDAEL